MNQVDEAFVRDAIEEANAVAAQAKCTCPHSVAIYDESVFWLQWWRCRMCLGLVARTRLAEGTATLLDGTIH